MVKAKKRAEESSWFQALVQVFTTDQMSGWVTYDSIYRKVDNKVWHDHTVGAWLQVTSESVAYVLAV